MSLERGHSHHMVVISFLVYVSGSHEFVNGSILKLFTGGSGQLRSHPVPGQGVSLHRRM